MRIYNIAICFLALFTASSFASGHFNSLNGYLSKNGMVTNVNKPVVIQDQQMGYLSGGSLVVRGRHESSIRPLTITTPSFDMDPCSLSGDFSLGGLSYINGQALKKFTTGIAKSAGGYITMMAATKLCPVCTSVMNRLEEISREVNSFTMNQCKYGQMLADNTFGAITANQVSKCKMRKKALGSHNDNAEIAKACEDNPFSADGENENTKKLKETMLPDEYNLMWHTLGKIEGQDVVMKELCMSLTGSIIAKKSGNKGITMNTLPSLLDDNFFNALMDADGEQDASKNAIQLYECDTKDICLNPKPKAHIMPANMVAAEIKKALQNVATKLKEGSPADQLSAVEQQLIEISSIPLLPLMISEISDKPRGLNHIYLDDKFVKLIAFDLIENWANSALKKATDSLSNQALTDDATGKVKDLHSKIEIMISHIQQKKHHLHERVALLIDLKQKLTQDRLYRRARIREEFDLR